jgi:Alw26I/Eco31I/Esp3I family type II restriction endonuclease
MDRIVDHPNYAGMPCTRDNEGKIDWVIPSNRPKGSKNWDGNERRRAWWREQALKLGIPLEGPWISKTARRLHPFGEKPCQTCGRVMKLAYAYPTRTTVRRLNTQLSPASQVDPRALLTIQEIASQLFEADPAEARSALAGTFRELVGVTEAADAIHRLDAIASDEDRRFSPGAMANPPDRLDGFHTYNLCCRGSEDTGRTTENLGSYGVDRRAYEQWCEGDWAAADALMNAVGMGVCQKPNCQSGGGVVQLTADHVGPISLGFRHSPRFVVACRTCNSGKGNRMSLDDVRTLIEWERESGNSEASWQAREIWDALKGEVTDDAEALRLSRVLRINQHHFLSILSQVAAAGATDALFGLLSLQYAENRYSFDGLDPTTLVYTRSVAVRRQDTYSESKKARAVRIGYDALKDYAAKDDRNVQAVADEVLVDLVAHVDRSVQRLLVLPSKFRTELNAALAQTGAGREAALAAAVGDGVDTSPELDAARRAVLDAVVAYLRAVSEVLILRFRAGSHMDSDALTRPRRAVRN